MGDKQEKPKVELSKPDIQNLIAIVSTHPTPEGVGSQAGQVKMALIRKLQDMEEGEQA